MRNRSLKRDSEQKADPADHYVRLADEFGSPRRGRYTAVDDGQPMTGARFWLQPLTLFILSLIALVVVGSLQLWRIGLLDPVFGPKGAVADKSPKRWMQNGHAARVVDDRTIDADEADVDHDPPPDTDRATLPADGEGDSATGDAAE